MIRVFRGRPVARIRLSVHLGMCMVLASPALLHAADNPRERVLAPLAVMAAKSIDRLNASDVHGALGVFKSFEALWSPVEDSVRAGNPGLYVGSRSLPPARRPRWRRRLLTLRAPARH